MENLFDIDWDGMLVPTISLVEMFLRGTAVYLFLFFMLRVMRRGNDSLTVSDLLVTVLIADAAQNAMGSKYNSLTEGAVLIVAIMFWNYFFDWLAFHSPRARRLLYPQPLPLVTNGVMQRRNMRRELITAEELMSQLRQEGIENLDEVKSCRLEPEGNISVIKR